MVGIPFLRHELAVISVTQDDVEAPHGIHVKSFRHGWDREMFQSFLQDPQVTGFAARPVDQPHKLTGFVLARLVAGEAEILSIAVDPDYRKPGTGYALMDALLRHLHPSRVEMLFFEVDELNTAARALYRGFRFTETGRRPGYYQSQSGCSDG